ncbi:hypothetical protein NQ314_010637 [Rhamnusium bicolor]|uniref:Uncharacterized protein n=1 Tax=Rhamnusium bicolor TaxID=1586634 RepID=A0AAV8XRX9_9CUCU|nr:hypothetical protein NQ314_010637 [Rhamnusium bicolor]
MGKRKHRHHRHRRSSSSSSRDTDSPKRAKDRVASERSFTPELPPPSADTPSLNSGLLDIVNMLKNEQRPNIGMSVRDIDITDFNPMFHDINEWISKIDEHAVIWPAETWYKSLQTIPKSWREWKSLLATTFPSTRDLHSLMTEMLLFKPKANQSLYEYCFEKLSLIRRMNLNLSGSDEVNLIVGSLDNQNVKFAVKAACITDPSKLAVYLKSFDTGTFSVIPQKYNNQVLPFKKGASQSLEVNSRYEGDRSKLHCNYCRNKGHTIDNCYKKLRRGQGSEPRPGSSNTRSDKQVLLISRDGDKNKFYKLARINETIEIQCFIDFGSECSLITAGLVKQLNLEIVILPKPVVLTVFGGSEIEVFSMTSCKLSVDSVCLPIELLVVEMCIPGIEVVIGQNFTEDYQIKYSRIGHELLFTNASLNVNVIGSVQEVHDRQVIRVGIDQPEVQSRIKIIVEDFPTCFPSKNSRLGCISGVKMTIKLKSDTPIVQRPYRLAEAEKVTLRELIDELMQDETIRPSQSPFASPVIMVINIKFSQICVDEAYAKAVRWYKNDDLFADSNNGTLLLPKGYYLWQNGALEILSVQPNDTAEYICEIERPGPWGTVTQKHAIEVLHSPSVEPFPPTGFLQVKLGEEVRMSCKGGGVPYPIITWFSKGEELKLLDHREILKFTASDQRLAGIYECSAVNGVGEPAKAQIQLSIIYRIAPPGHSGHVGPLSFFRSISWIHTAPSHRAQIDCRISADPQATVTWLKGEVPVPLDNRVISLIDGDKYTLLIRNVQRSDFGIYTCRAINELGQGELHIQLSGVPNPGVFKKTEDKNLQGQNSYTLIWEVDSYTPIIEYNLWFRPYNPRSGIHQTKWTKLTIPTEHSSGPVYSKSYTIRGLNEKSIYEALLVSRNRYGWSKPSPILRFATTGAGKYTRTR